MSYTFIPKNYLEALMFFLEVPFYHLTNVFKKSPLHFKDNEIKHIEIYSNKLEYRVFYEAHSYTGFVSFKSAFNESEFEGKEVKKAESNVKSKLIEIFHLIFHRHSAPVWHILMTIIVLVVFVYLTKTGIIFSEFFKPRGVPNFYCDVHCVNLAYKNLMWVRFNTFLRFFGIATCVYLCFFKAKKLTEAKFVRSVQTSALILIAVNIGMSVNLVSKILDPKFSITYKIVYHPEYFKEKNNRSIASEVETLKNDFQDYSR